MKRKFLLSVGVLALVLAFGLNNRVKAEAHYWLTCHWNYTYGDCLCLGDGSHCYESDCSLGCY